MNNMKKFGLWSSITSAMFHILWCIAFQLQDVIASIAFIFAGIVFTRNAWKTVTSVA